MRYFLLDKVRTLQPGQRAVGVKNISLTEQVLHDHFPDHPILPGALVVEAAAQLAGLLLESTFDDGSTAFPLRAVLVQIKNAKFHATAGPGDQLVIEVRLDSLLAASGAVSATIMVEDRRIATARLLFSMQQIESERLHAQRRRLYAIWTRQLDVEVR